MTIVFFHVDSLLKDDWDAVQIEITRLQAQGIVRLLPTICTYGRGSTEKTICGCHSR